jgi:UDP-2,4-diacetamido-2,4,6-trideoxy-beta-L-altropyranose hydrolase
MTSFPPLRLAVRTDASSAIGTGHVFRCLALTDELRRLGGEVVFVCAKTQGNLADMLIEMGYSLRWIPDRLSPEADANATLAALAEDGKFDWLLVDHYGLDVRWERILRSSIRRLVALDDLADRSHDVDLLLDSSHDTAEAVLYEKLVPPGATLAVGQEYILLRREFFGRTPPERNAGPVRRILVTLGGNDPLNATGLTLDALDDPVFSGIQIDLTLGLSNPRLEHHKSRASAMPNVTAHVQSSRMADLMADADLCLGAGGMTSRERCYMGLPSLILVLAENQLEFATKLERMGCARNLGYADRLHPDQLRAEMHAAVIDPAWRQNASLKSLEQVDGRGAPRTIDLMFNLSAHKRNTEVAIPCS